ncbi:unnamed protein product [Symbiodinium natans]|uniref:Ubiquitin-like domain-containing protein n=1 Tax=Symbiodinium natans TaxID=878477 RepID=A0A812TBQ7_9DINO|nr:unnamed protein product [Symbiodinium natans]
MPRATVSFKHEEQEWTHEFEVDSATTVLDLKRKMTSSAPEHASWFDLCRDGSTVKNSDLVDPLAIYIFQYLGPSGTEQASHSSFAVIRIMLKKLLGRLERTTMIHFRLPETSLQQRWLRMFQRFLDGG